MPGNSLRVCQRLVWKNVRETRQLWLTVGIGICIGQWAYALTGMPANDPERTMEVLAATIWIPVMCCTAGNVVLAFAGERHRGTDVRLSAMNISPGVALASTSLTAAIPLVLLSIAGTLNAYLIEPLGIKHALMSCAGPLSGPLPSPLFRRVKLQSTQGVSFATNPSGGFSPFH